LGFPFILALVLLSIGYWLPTFQLKRTRHKRLAKFSAQLPQALRTMTTAIKAGFSIVQAIQLVGKEADDPIAYEFTRTIREINLGVSLEEAFENFAKRVPNEDLKIMITAILIQRTVGGNLADILEIVQQTIQDRIKIKQELHTLTAQGRMSAWIITMLPVALALILFMMSPDYFSPMLTHPLGWGMLGGGVCSGVLGWLMIQKMIKIEV
jgi:tight adherence protein B